ncbi:MAG TPA: PDZ domain-containing protein [Pseudoxanthomonas sp.]|jgi:membrane-associated protease RseP (regulator of RpoE activity)|nr:PDZ domain-containing protein [Pseudoxanthomonas sp.]
MKRRIRQLSIAALALATGLAFATQAQDDAANAAKRKELDTARAELQRAAQRVADLSRDQEVAAMKKRIELRPMLGVLLAPDPQAGVRITGVTPDSGAARAGLRAGDQLIKIDDKPISGQNPEQRLASARARLGELKVGQPVAVVYRRGPQETRVGIEPQPGRPVMVFTDDGGGPGKRHTRVVMSPDGEAVETVNHIGEDFQFDHNFEFDFGDMDFNSAELAITPEIQRELMRVRELSDCDGEECVALPRLAEAFRWNGLNLSSIDPQLGRYFGTDSGVLVLSTGADLASLQAGDVIKRVDGKAVTTPREVMESLRGRPADSSVKVEYLRDRKTASAMVTIPRAMPLRIPVPPAPPAPPAAPAAPSAPAAPAPPSAKAAPPAPPAAPAAAPKAPRSPSPPPAPPTIGIPV